MLKKFTVTIAFMGFFGAAITALPTAAIAGNSYHHQHHQHHRDDQARDQYYNGGTYQARDQYDRSHCGSGNGAVGTIAGGAGGALLGNALGGGTLGTVAGGIGGALVGRHFDKQHTRDRNRERNGC